MAKYVIGLVLAALAFEQRIAHESELTQATVAIDGLRWGWVLLGVAAEAASRAGNRANPRPASAAEIAALLHSIA